MKIEKLQIIQPVGNTHHIANNVNRKSEYFRKQIKKINENHAVSKFDEMFRKQMDEVDKAFP